MERRLRVILEPKETREPTAPANGQPHSVAVQVHSSVPVEVVNPSPPAHGERGEHPGPRGCWAVKRDGTPCGAARRADSDYCTAHSGLGVAANPAEWSRVGGAVAADNRRRRAALRLELGISRPSSIRGMLKAKAYVEAERVVAAALAPITDPDVPPAQRSRAALALVDAVDPPQKAVLGVPLPTNAEGIDGLSLSELRALVERVS